MGRLEPAAPEATGHSGLDTAAKRSEWPPSRFLPTFMVAPAAEVNVSLMAVSVSSPDRGDRLLTLQSWHTLNVHGECCLWVGQALRPWFSCLRLG